TQWGPGEFNKRSLQLSQAELYIRPDLSNTDSISLMVHVKPTVDLDEKTVLYVGVLEQLVPKVSLGARQDMIKSGEDDFEFVVKKMLPSVLGTKTSTHPRATSSGILEVPPDSPPVAADTTYVFGPFIWVPEPSLFYSPNTNDLAIGVFLQNEDTKEIFQSEIVFNLNDPIVTVTGLENLLPEDVLTYPNPANEQLTVELPGEFDQPLQIRLVDQTGRATDGGTIPSGHTRKTIDTGNLAAGMYILQLEGTGANPIRKKVMIVH
ncbi:MAG: T9SS type A sorting domain-containing protein, partial [Cyclobacteriaceae bacterium]